MNTLDKLRLLILHGVARMLGIQLTYTLKFLPMSGRKRVDLRGRGITSAGVSVRKAIDLFTNIERDPSARKEKTDGIYYVEIEGREGIHYHAPVAAGQSGGVSEGLSDAAQDGPAATAATQAAADDEAGAAGAGEVGGRADRPQADAKPYRPMGTDEVKRVSVIPMGGSLNDTDGIGPAIQGPTGRPSLDQLGER